MSPYQTETPLLIITPQLIKTPSAFSVIQTFSAILTIGVRNPANKAVGPSPINLTVRPRYAILKILILGIHHPLQRTR